MPPEQSKAFKNWFDREAAVALAEQISQVYPELKKQAFVRHCCRKLDTLEFNARVKQFSSAFEKTLPGEYPEAISVLTRSLPPLLPNCEAISNGWLQWPIGQFIADNGQHHFTESMEAMVALTQRFSSEFAVRPFVEHQPDATFKYLYTLLDNRNSHVRRWCSEGTRTRLPWGNKLHQLILDPGPIWPILEALKGDEALYVRRSVANSINDLSKDHPEMVLERCKAWSKQGDESIDWVVKHGLRGLIKAGNQSALAIIGYKKPNKIEAVLTLSPVKINVGESVRMQVVVTNESTRLQDLMIDYIVYYQAKNGARRAKVFKWKTISLAANSEEILEKKHPMKLTTIRALYPGDHEISLQINGAIVAGGSFRLIRK